MTIKVLAKGDNAAEVLIFDVIGADFFGEGLTAKSVRKELDALGEVEDILVRINSPGGNVWDGIAIFNMLKEHAAQVHVQVEGIAASAASLIAMAGDLITMGEGSMMMIHNPYGLAIGDGNELRKAADMLDKVKSEFVDIYSRRSGAAADDVGTMMDEETWMNGAEAVDKGFADERTNEQAQLAAGTDWDRIVSLFKHPPKSLTRSGGAQQLAAAAVSPKSAHAGAKPKEADMKDDKAPASAQTADIEAAVKAAKAEALLAEKNRRTGIKDAFGKFAEQHAALLAECLDDVECSVDQAREKLLAKVGEGAVPVSGALSVTVGTDAREKFVEGASRALMARAGLEKREAGNEYSGQTLWQLGAIALERAGISTRGLSPDGIARKVLGSLSSSDFPQLLSSTAGKKLRDAYTQFPNTYQQWCAIGEVSDFKIAPRIQMGSFNNLDTIPEGGEYKYGDLSETYENAQAETKGKGIRMTRQMIVNDDLGGFMRRAGFMGRAAARTVNSDAYALLTSGSGNNGPTSVDTGQYFNATAATTAGGHANLTASGVAVTTASIAVGRKAMRVQKDSGLRETLNILPKVLVAPVAIEDIAWAVLNSISDPSQSNSNKKNYAQEVARLDLATDPYLDGISATAWYLFADPMDAAAAFEVVFLDGNQEPFLDDMVDFDTDSMSFKVRLDYGVAIGDWRGGYKNAGA